MAAMRYPIPPGTGRDQPASYHRVYPSGLLDAQASAGRSAGFTPDIACRPLPLRDQRPVGERTPDRQMSGMPGVAPLISGWRSTRARVGGWAGVCRTPGGRGGIPVADFRCQERFPGAGPTKDGLQLLADVADDPALGAVRVIMLTTFELDEYVFESLRHVASGFLLKDASPDKILDAIRVVADGGSPLAPSVTRRVIEEFAGSRSRPHPCLDYLTEREKEILGWVATGRSNAEIAHELVLSPDTVLTHVSRAMVKLQARDRAQLVVFAIESGLRVRP